MASLEKADRESLYPPCVWSDYRTGPGAGVGLWPLSGSRFHSQLLLARNKT